MLKPLTVTTCVGLAALLSYGMHVAAETGPIREGARRTGEAVAEGTRAVVRGSREAIGRAGQATREAVRTTGDAARAQLDRGERSEVPVNAGAVANADANDNLNAGAHAGPVQVQADANVNQSQLLDANGQTYDADNSPRYESGFRGTEDQNMPSDPNLNQQGQAHQQAGRVDYNGRIYQVRHDSRGREFICVGGCPVYFDSQSGSPQSREAYKMNSESMRHDSTQYNGAHQSLNNSQNIDAEHNTYIEQGRNDSVPAPPAPVRADVQDVNPAGPTLNTDAEASADANANLNRDANIGAEPNASASGESKADSQEGSPSPRDENNEPGEGTESSADNAPNPGT